MTSGGLRGALGGQLDRSGLAPGRRLGRPEALLGGAWGGFGGSCGAVGGRLDPPGDLREASGGSGEGLREPMLVLFLVVMQKKPGKVPKY